jgi:glycosyltransferase involved in cell wall biosynthesis
MACVDVIVPCYNYGRFLRECVESILRQDVDLRVLIIDDCSSDHTPDVAAALRSEDCRVEFRRHATNHGHIATYNEGLEWLSSEYALLISADDLLVPGALARASALMDAQPDVGFVYGRIIPWSSDQPRPVHGLCAGAYTHQVISGLEWIQTVCDEGRPPTTSPEVVVRTRLQQKLGGYRHDLPHWADVDLLLRFAANSNVGFLDIPQAYYRIHGSNMHTIFSHLDILQQHRKTFRSFFDANSDKIHCASALKSRALRRVAEDACSAAYQAFERRDIELCKSCLDFAADTYPGIRSTPEHVRLRWKVRLGHRAVGLIRPLYGRLRASALQGCPHLP